MVNVNHEHKGTILKFSVAKISKQGGREYNEDACDYVHIENEVHIVLADGLGGHGGGHVASATCVENALFSMRTAMFSAQAIQDAVMSAQDAIINKQQSEQRYQNMRSTIVVCWMKNEQCIWGHVGDSRLYHFSKGEVIFQTRDHSVPQVLAATGEIHSSEIRYHDDRNRLTSALGNSERLKITCEQSPHPLLIGDVILLCTDGFWEHITEIEMQVDLAKSKSVEDWLRLMEIRLLERVDGTNDNYSAVAVGCL